MTDQIDQFPDSADVTGDSGFHRRVILSVLWARQKLFSTNALFRHHHDRAIIAYIVKWSGPFYDPADDGRKSLSAEELNQTAGSRKNAADGWDTLLYGWVKGGASGGDCQRFTALLPSL